MRFRLLGPVEVRADDDRLVVLPRRQERALLAILLLECGRMVTTDRLCELLWDGDPPAKARPALQVHVARLRSALSRTGDVASQVELVTAGDGYLLRAPTDSVDVLRFRGLLRDADRADDLRWRYDLLQEALTLWHGPPLQNAATEWLRQRLCTELEELHRVAVEEEIATALALGQHREQVPRLAGLTAEHPDRERLAELYMLALVGIGRTADALDAFARVRTHLVEHLGLEPGAALRDLQGAILRGESPAAAAGPAVEPKESSTAAVPAQLPADLRGFVGRAKERNWLDAHLLEPEDAADGGARIALVCGTAGVGKTTLAVHWAYRVAAQFPDGQLYVNLRGFAPGDTALPPSDAIHGFLDALGVPPKQIPVGLDAQAALYRSRLAGRRVLILLDNAKDADQVRPLLPGAAGCVVLITSRQMMRGLLAAEAAVALPIDLLPRPYARQLLARRLGNQKIAAEPQAAEHILDLCAGLPLALAVTAARAATQHDHPLAALAAELDDAQTRLDGLSLDDATTDVRTVFSWSYRRLTPPAARLFRLFGVHPGPDISIAAAASLAARPAATVRPLIQELERAYLLTERTPGRYASHDLLRAYAIERVNAEDSAEERNAALGRTLDHYLHSTCEADRLLRPGRYTFAPDPPRDGVAPVRMPDHDTALAWLDAEYPNLIAAVNQAGTAGFARHAWQLVWALTEYFHRRGHLQDWVASQHTALAATREYGDGIGEAHVLRGLAAVYGRLNQYDQAVEYLTAALDRYAALDDPEGQGRTHHNLCWMLERQGNHAAALKHALHSRDHYAAAGDRSGLADALNAVGWCRAHLGDHRTAIDDCTAALDLYREVGDRYGQAATLDTMGYAYWRLGQLDPAVEHMTAAVTELRALGNRHGAAYTLRQLGEVHREAGRPDSARVAWTEALEVLDEQSPTEATELRDQLATLTTPA